MGKKFKVLYNKTTILNRVKDLAQQISQDYPSGELILVGVLKGGFIFLADLVRALKIPVLIDFVRLASYGASTHSSEKVTCIDFLNYLQNRQTSRISILNVMRSIILWTDLLSAWMTFLNYLQNRQVSKT